MASNVQIAGGYDAGIEIVLPPLIFYYLYNMISDKVDFGSKEFLNLCKTHQVKELYAFGSVVNGDFTDKSDIDLLVDIDEPNPVHKGKLILSLYHKFGELFNKKIDLLTVDSIRNPTFEEYVGTTKSLIYPLTSH